MFLLCVMLYDITHLQECRNGNDTSQWKRPKFYPLRHLNPLTDSRQNWRAQLRHSHYPHAKFYPASGVSVPCIQDFAVILSD